MNRVSYFFYPVKIKVKKNISRLRYFFRPSQENLIEIIYLVNLEKGRIENLALVADRLDRKITNRQLHYIYELCIKQKRFDEANKALSLVQ